jgi:hypothetical protein
MRLRCKKRNFVLEAAPLLATFCAIEIKLYSELGNMGLESGVFLFRIYIF